MNDLHNPPDYLDWDQSDSFPFARPVSKRLRPPQRVYDAEQSIDNVLRKMGLQIP